ncbi:MAG: hypothetical protein Ct9H90mP19_2840 [Gammaproteobacteria bacterium]|nr:MAG: hypothetical protein Ct9H90mP19_2840 [Gammaproteobacteria bacterium]
MSFTDSLGAIPEGISFLENIRFFNGEKEKMKSYLKK